MNDACRPWQCDLFPNPVDVNYPSCNQSQVKEQLRRQWQEDKERVMSVN
jgi:hypothetical protein